jgi:hypothetical protein
MARKKQPPTPPAAEGQDCTITFGSNADVQRVLLQFSVSAERLLFTPADARDVANKLLRYADLAEGKK